jgi:hypothetical protein
VTTERALPRVGVDDAPVDADGAPALPEGVLAVRLGPGANCSSVGSAIDVLFYGSVVAGAVAVALAAAFPPKIEDEEPEGGGEGEAGESPTPSHPPEGPKDAG